MNVFFVVIRATADITVGTTEVQVQGGDLDAAKFHQGFEETVRFYAKTDPNTRHTLRQEGTGTKTGS